MFSYVQHLSLPGFGCAFALCPCFKGLCPFKYSIPEAIIKPILIYQRGGFGNHTLNVYRT